MKRFSVVENGYDINEVNNFVDVVIKRLEKLNNENTNYLAELTRLKEEFENYKKNTSNVEGRVTEAIIAANETANRMKQVARDEANLIINEARDNASAIVHEALINAQKTEQDNELLKKNMVVYESKVRSLIEAQLRLMDEFNKDN